MMMRQCLMQGLAAGILAVVVALVSPARARHAILTIDVPTAGEAYGFTKFVAINDLGQILGYDLATPGSYLLTNPGTVQAQVQPLACPGLATETFGENLNRYGEVVGRCGTSGFLRTRTGAYTLLVYPGITSSWGTVATGINNLRQVVGSYETGTFWHGFRWSAGQYTPLDVTLPEATQTFPTAINYQGHIAGYYFWNHPEFPGYGKTSGFLFRNGVFEQIDVPFPGTTHTWIWDMNDRGHILGHFHAEDGTTFLASDFILIDGTFYYAILPAPPNVTTLLQSINNRFQLVGGRELVNPLTPGAGSYYRGVLSTWDRREAQPIAAQAATVRRLQQPSPETSGLTPEAECQAVTASGPPVPGKLLGLHLVCSQHK